VDDLDVQDNSCISTRLGVMSWQLGVSLILLRVPSQPPLIVEMIETKIITTIFLMIRVKIV
jgi:hypothetical protein